MTMKIDEIVTKEALEQVDILINKLKEATKLENKLGNSVTLKVQVLTEVLSIEGCPRIVWDAATAKLQELIPLL